MVFMTCFSLQTFVKEMFIRKWHILLLMFVNTAVRSKICFLKMLALLTSRRNSQQTTRMHLF